MDVRFINPFVASVKHVYKTVLGVDIVVGRPLIKSADAAGADVSAIIGLSGDAAGSVVLAFPMLTAVKSASTFTGTEITQNHEGFTDALGELAQRVVSEAKAQLDELNVAISSPDVVVGRERIASQARPTPMLGIPCDSSLGRFAVEVALVVKKAQPAAGG